MASGLEVSTANKSQRRGVNIAKSCPTSENPIGVVLEFPSDQTWVIEIKRFSAPTVSKGFYLAAADVGASRKVLVAPVDQPFPMKDGIEVMNPLTATV
jgi:hypothetical protein